MKKRILSLILTVCMCLPMLSTASAAEINMDCFWGVGKTIGELKARFGTPSEYGWWDGEYVAFDTSGEWFGILSDPTEELSDANICMQANTTLERLIPGDKPYFTLQELEANFGKGSFIEGDWGWELGYDKTYIFQYQGYSLMFIPYLVYLGENGEDGTVCHVREENGEVRFYPQVDVSITYEIEIFLNGNRIVSDQPPIIENNRTLVPFRAICEAMGATVDWDSDKKQVTAELDGTTLVFEIDMPYVFVNGIKKELDQPPIIRNGRTLLPARAFAEELGAQVQWDEEYKIITINR